MSGIFFYKTRILTYFWNFLGAGFAETVHFVFSKFDEVRLPDAVLGISSIVVLLALRVISSISIDFE